MQRGIHALPIVASGESNLTHNRETDIVTFWLNIRVNKTTGLQIQESFDPPGLETSRARVDQPHSEPTIDHSIPLTPAGLACDL